MTDSVEQEIQSQIDQLNNEKNEFFISREINLPNNILNYRKKNQMKKNTLKSDLKKSNTFVKKLRSINSEGIQQCIRDVETLNLSLFISEIVNSIVATTYKPIDTSNMVKLCISLHQFYEEFSEQLLINLKQVLLQPFSEEDAELGKRRRIQIRFLVELYQVGMFVEEEYFIQLLRNLLGKPFKIGTVASNKPNATDLASLGTFVKYGSECLFGYLPRKVIELASKTNKSINELPTKIISTLKIREQLCSLISTSYRELSIEIIQLHKSYRNKESRAEKDKLIHGSLTETKQAELEQAKKAYDKLLSIVSILSECMNEAMPILEVEKDESEDNPRNNLTVMWEGGVTSSKLEGDVDTSTRGGLYEDAEARTFYEDLVDLLSQVPLTVLGLTPEQATSMSEKWEKDKSEQLARDATSANNSAENANTSSDSNLEGGDLINNDEGGGTTEDLDENQNDDTNTTTNTNTLVDASSVQGIDGGTIPEDNNNMDESKTNKLVALLDEKLPESVNKAKADEFCIAFCHVGTKNARKKLVQSLLRIPRSRTELAATYARIIATLSRLYPDIIPPILDGLRKEFFGIQKTKNQLYIDNKVKNVRYIGELIKFRVAPPIIAFRIFKTLLQDFSNHNLQLLATLLETCGRFLYVLPYTHDRMEEILATMVRMRRSRNLDLHQQTLLESAYFVVKPPERRVIKKIKTYTIAQQYVRYLIIERLDDKSNSISIDNLIKSLRKLPWNDSNEKISYYALKAILKVSRTKYTMIPNLADCISGLAEYQPNLLVQLVDRILEEIQHGLEVPYKREMHRMLGLVKLLGELYNFTAISSTIIFDLLYHLINFGHSEIITTTTTNNTTNTIIKYDPQIYCEFDPINDLFRAQIICEILNTCGVYYVRGNTKNKLARFLIYFQRYLLIKQYIPLHIEFAILDTFDNLEHLVKESNKKEIQKKSNKSYYNKPHSNNDHNESILTFTFPRYETLDKVQQVIDTMETLENSNNLSNNNNSNLNNNQHNQDDEMNEDDEEEDDEDDDDNEEDVDNENTNNDMNSENENEEDEHLIQQQQQDEEPTEEELEYEMLQQELQAKKMLEKLRLIEEDDEFELAYKSTMQESLSSVTNINKNNVDKMVIPAVLPKPKNTFRIQPNEYDDEDDDLISNHHNHHNNSSIINKEVAFKLLSRDTKGRFETRQMLVPSNNKMAIKLIQAESELKLEKQKLKEKVLQMEQLANEAEFHSDDERGYYGHRTTYNNKTQVRTATTTSTTTTNNVTTSSSNTSNIGHNRINITSPTHHNKSYSKNNRVVRMTETHKPLNSLNLDEFLAESNAAEIRRIIPK